MSTFAVVTVFLIGVAHAVPFKRQGICVEECNPSVPAFGCPFGTECKSNGCGHTCQISTLIINKKSVNLGICADLCDPKSGDSGCPVGSDCVFNGCGHHCAIPIINKRLAEFQVGACVDECRPPLGLSCPPGSVCRSNGCGHTCQKDLPILIN